MKSHASTVSGHTMARRCSGVMLLTGSGGSGSPFLMRRVGYWDRSTSEVYQRFDLLRLESALTKGGRSIMNKYLTEFIGTFFLVLTIGCSVIGGGPSVVPPLAIGAILMVMVYAGGHVSGGHYNPAVTLGLWMRGRCDTTDVAPYWVAQIVGALAAAFATKFIVGPTDVAIGPRIGPALLAEFLFTFALVYVVLNVATSKASMGNPFYGAAIGMTVMAGAFSVGMVSGAAFNPAVAIGISTMGLIPPTSIWIHIVADMAAAAAAAMLFKYMHPEDR